MRVLSFLLFLLTGFGISCTKLTNVDGPPNRFDNPFQNDASATSLILGIYEKNMDKQCVFNGHMSRYGALQSGELALRIPNGDDGDFQLLRLKPNNRALSFFWLPPYECIARCNLVLHEIPAANEVSETLKSIFQGEAYFLRALSYFYLVNLFDSIPLVTGTNIGDNSRLPQVAASTIYAQIISDLEAALPLLPERHPDTGFDSLRHTRVELGAAQALLARIYLYRGQYEQAVLYASLVINQGSYQLEDILKTFQYLSRETILQFKPVSPNANTVEGQLFLQDVGGIPNYELTTSLIQSFESGDQRKLQWTRTLRVGNQDKFQVKKYTIVSGQPRQEYNVVLRLAEQYLIRAEARVRLGDLTGALSDLNVVRKRAGLPSLTENNSTINLLHAIARERQIELFSEWGHRLLDLYRWWTLPTGDALQDYADIALKSRPGWAPYMRHWPIPQQELINNPHLHQNKGY